MINKHKIISSEIRQITTKTGRTYRKRVVTVECPSCKKIYEKIHYHDRTTECVVCSTYKMSQRNIGKGCKTIGEFNGGYYTMYKRNAEKRGLEFSVSQQYLWDLFLEQDKLCKISGLPINLKSKHIKNKQATGTHLDRSLITASIDRIDSSKGYIKGNIQWVHKVINIMKGNLSDNDFVYFCRQISNFDLEKGNTEPRLLTGGNYFRSKVQRLTGEGPTNNPDTRTQQLTSPLVDDIV